MANKQFDAFWTQLCGRNPGLLGSTKMTLTVESFRIQMAIAFNEGARSEKAKRKAADAFASFGGHGKGPFGFSF